MQLRQGRFPTCSPSRLHSSPTCSSHDRLTSRASNRQTWAYVTRLGNIYLARLTTPASAGTLPHRRGRCSHPYRVVHPPPPQRRYSLHSVCGKSPRGRRHQNSSPVDQFHENVGAATIALHLARINTTTILVAFATKLLLSRDRAAVPKGGRNKPTSQSTTL